MFCSNSIVLPYKQLQLSSFFLLDIRYAPATQIWRGRLHVMGGSKENRNAVAYDHWSIAVKDGKALDHWREEVPIPRGGPHRFFFFYNSCSSFYLLFWSLMCYLTSWCLMGFAGLV